MKDADLTQLQNCDHTYAEASARVSEKYTASWDDAVHESFRRFVSQVQENSRAIHSDRITAEQLRSSAEDIPVDELVQKAKKLVKEANAL